MKYRLEIITFIAGGTVMVLELVGSRFVAPYLGTSIFVWTSLIGVVLASLSIGYWWGGRIADKHPHPHILSRIILLSAILSCFIIIFEPFLTLLTSLSFGLRSTATITSILLFSPVTIMLGMISPYVVRLKLQEIATAGSAVGSLYAIGTLGSIVGTFLGGFVLISYFGTKAILIGISLTLFLLYFFSLTLHTNKLIPKKLVGIFVCLFLLQGIFFFSNDTTLADIDSQYNRWMIKDSYDHETRQPTRLLINNIYGYQSGIYKHDPDTLFFKYLRMFDLAGVLKPDFTTSLLIGAGAYTYPMHFISHYKDETKVMDTVEIDSKLDDIAKEYFQFKENPRIHIFEEDGRIFLNNNTKKYDVILLDAFSSQLSIPYHLTTREAVTHLKSSLSDNGLIMANVVSAQTGRGSSFLKAVYNTYKEQFPYVEIILINPTEKPESVQNLMLIASPVAFPKELYEQTLIPHHTLISTVPILTDNFAPVEKYGEEMLSSLSSTSL